jgi:hypothetical protein
MWTTPVIVSTSLSVLALVVASGSAVWQVVSWRRSGPRVEVAARAAATGFGGHLVVIEAKNSGRLSTQVQACGFELPSGRHIFCPFNFEGQPLPLPAELHAGGAVSFHFNPSDVAIPFAAEEITGEGVRAYVVTGHGRIRGEEFHLGNMLKALKPTYGFKRRNVIADAAGQ